MKHIRVKEILNCGCNTIYLCESSDSEQSNTCSEKGKGKISIPFSNEEELERIIGILDTLKK